MRIDQVMAQIEKFMTNLLVSTPGGAEVAPPEVLGPNIVKIRLLLVQLVSLVAEVELEYRRAKAAKYDKFLKEGMKKSPAMDALKFEQDLIEQEINVERIKAYSKYVDSLISSIQSLMKVQVSGERGQY